MHARVVTFQGSLDKIQDPGSHFRERVLPVLRQQTGFKSTHLLVDRTRGKLVGISLWESEQAVEAARAALDPIGRESAAAFGASAPSVESYEVVYSG
jgi:hypothetical protein